MSGGRWRLQRVDDDDSESGWEVWQVLLIDDDDSEVIAQTFDEKWARHIITSLRWWDTALGDGKVSIPKPPPVTRKRTTRSKA